MLEKLKTFRCLILAILDYVIIGIVIYGIPNLVYDGYPKIIPYLIIIFFFIMSLFRLREFSYILKSSGSVDKENVEELFIDDEKSEDETEEHGFFHRRAAKEKSDKFNKH